ncbi:MAG: dihydropteroate synthase [Planctomycetes bacterium]|nr:dihydropteroate synthase [Planctomycetota bacterium]
MGPDTTRPWHLQGFELPHHALPLADGMWRGPKPPANGATQLASIGLEPGAELADGAVAYRVDWQALQSWWQSRAGQPEFHSAQKFLPQMSEWIAARIWLGRQALAQFPPAPQFMAILNLTPDSFSDGGQLMHADRSVAIALVVKQAQLAISQGAAWLDLGAESTRPGAAEISAQQQLDRLLPAIHALLPLQIPLSIDTRSADVAQTCLQAGATMINDVSGFGDEQMASVCAAAQCPTTLMHMRGKPATMQQHCQYRDLMGEVADEWAQSAARGLTAGLSGAHIYLDPGIGFAKTALQNYQLMADVGALRALGFPLLLGPSRKSFLAEQFPHYSAIQRDCGSAGAAACCAFEGAAILRLHQASHWDAVEVAARLGQVKNGSTRSYNSATHSPG